MTFEFDRVAGPQPAWKVILKTNDAEALEQTIGKLRAAGHMPAEPVEDSGVTYYTVRVPSQGKLTEVAYAFADGHLIFASSRQGMAEAVQLHRTGASLARSPRLLATLPSNHKLEASAVFYQDPLAMASLQLQQAPPQMRDLLSKMTGQMVPSVIWVYGEKSAIREASKSAGRAAGAA